MTNIARSAANLPCPTAASATVTLSLGEMDQLRTAHAAAVAYAAELEANMAQVRVVTKTTIYDRYGSLTQDREEVTYRGFESFNAEITAKVNKEFEGRLNNEVLRNDRLSRTISEKEKKIGELTDKVFGLEGDLKEAKDLLTEGATALEEAGRKLEVLHTQLTESSTILEAMTEERDKLGNQLRKVLLARSTWQRIKDFFGFGPKVY